MELHCNYMAASSSRKSIRSNIAFSLVETVLAIGIISFSILTILSLIPVGMKSVRSAMDHIAEAEIVQNISGTAILTPFSEMTNFNGQVFYYDQNGLLQTTATPDTRYWATTYLSNSVYPGSDTAPIPLSNSLVSIEIEIVHASSAAAATTAGSAPDFFNIQVPNSGN